MELGYLHNKIQQSINTLFIDVGTVAQGLVIAIRRELTEYYQALAVLDSQVRNLFFTRLISGFGEWKMLIEYFLYSLIQRRRLPIRLWAKKNTPNSNYRRWAKLSFGLGSSSSNWRLCAMFWKQFKIKEAVRLYLI